MCGAGGGLCDSLLIDVMRFSAVCVWTLINLNDIQTKPNQTDLCKYCSQYVRCSEGEEICGWTGSSITLTPLVSGARRKAALCAAVWAKPMNRATIFIAPASRLNFCFRTQSQQCLWC